MAKPRNNYYAVLSGRQPGIYKTWAECQRQVVGFKGARFKGFVTLAEAQSYMDGSEGTKAFDADRLKQGTVIFVDGSYRHGCYSWGFAAYQNGQLVLRTRAGEILQRQLDCGMWLAKWLEPSRLFSGPRLREKKQLLFAMTMRGLRPGH